MTYSGLKIFGHFWHSLKRLNISLHNIKPREYQQTNATAQRKLSPDLTSLSLVYNANHRAQKPLHIHIHFDHTHEKL